MLHKKHQLGLTSLLLVIGLLSFSPLSAQSFYGEIGVQYGVPIFGDYKESSVSLAYNGIDAVRTTEEDRFSVGQGFQFNLGVGYFISENFSFKVKGNYFSGESAQDFQYEEKNSSGVQQILAVFSAKASYLGISPMLMLHTPKSDSRINFSVGFGALFGLANYQENRNFTVGTQEQYFEVEYDGDWSIGASGELSMNYRLSNNMYMKAGLNITVLDFVPKTSEVVTFELDGRSSMRLLSEREKSTIYGNRIQNFRTLGGELVESIIDEEPRLSPGFDIPFSNIGLELGLVIGLK